MKNGQGRPRLVSWLLKYIARYPHFCCFCHQKTNNPVDLCQSCWSHLPVIRSKTDCFSLPKYCLYCGNFVHVDKHSQKCAACAKNRSLFEQIICPFHYKFPVDHLIRRVKFNHHLPTSRLLGSLLADEVMNTKAIDGGRLPDLLISVPAEPSRYRRRGFNPSTELANWCGKTLSIPLAAGQIGRHKGTPSLVGLSRAERTLAIRGSFWVSEQLRDKHVAIVDDVMTTGATAGELAPELMDTGVASVQLWVVARTPSSHVFN